MDTRERKHLSAVSKECLDKFQQIVTKSMEEEELIVRNLLNPPDEILTPGQKISDRVARFGGSWKFIIAFTVILALWILYNAVSPKKDQFDPFPFILMNLVLSCIAALQAPIIMMSQNRQEEKDRQRSENDYLVNMKAEMEIRRLHEKMDLLVQEQVDALYKTQEEQMQLLLEINKKLDKHHKG